MTDSLYDLLTPYMSSGGNATSAIQTPDASRYLSRILSLGLVDLTTTEPEALQQAAHSTNVSIQALSSRSHRTTTTSFDHLSTLSKALPELSTSTTNIRNVVPELDQSAITFASSYGKSKDVNPILDARKQSMLLSRQADKLQDILELPGLLAAAITSAGTSTAGGANYSQALDLFAHIRRLQILFPGSSLVQSVQTEAQVAMKDMTTNLITALRGQNIRLAAAIRTIGWLRRVLPELSTQQQTSSPPPTGVSFTTPTQQDEDDFGAIFLCARLCTFLTMTEALAPLRDLADQETARRLQAIDDQPSTSSQPRRPSHTGYATQGQQTERYLKRYIEIFREQSFSAISMFRNVFPTEPSSSTYNLNLTDHDQKPADDSPLRLPSALSTFPLHLIEILMATLRTYLPNITDATARESLLIQVLYAANSLGRLGADFSMMIAFLDQPVSPATAAAAVGVEGILKEREENERSEVKEDGDEKPEIEDGNEPPKKQGSKGIEPEWISIIKKHRVQSARLEALAAGQDHAVNVAGPTRRIVSGGIAVR